MDYKYILISFIVISYLALLYSSSIHTQQKPIYYSTTQSKRNQATVSSVHSKNTISHILNEESKPNTDLREFLLLLIIPSSFLIIIIITLILIWRKDKIPSHDKEKVAKMKKIINRVKYCSIELETLCYLCLENININDGNEDNINILFQEEQKTIPILMSNNNSKKKKTKLPCGHSYHCSCLNNWNQINELYISNLDLYNDTNATNNDKINICPRCKDGQLNNEAKVSDIKNSIVKIQLQMHPSLSRMSFISEKKKEED